ncbi:hypothetical protein SSX86_010393 [Deinandra increscens subsp. villosa]|uniref:FAR1 domain-containing protein n=1 Tax=Deinandra increscens subsp. villosa TaxID=3103831 RepID=A0AAP0DBQ4_9ASTR
MSLLSSFGSLPDYGQQQLAGYDKQSYEPQPYHSQHLSGYGQQSYEPHPYTSQPFLGYDQQLYEPQPCQSQQYLSGYGQQSYDPQSNHSLQLSDYGNHSQQELTHVSDTFNGNDTDDSGSSIHPEESDVIPDEEPNDYRIRDVIVSYKTDQYFDSRADLEDWVKKRGSEYKFAIVVGKSRKKKDVELVCNRSGEPKIKGVLRRTGSIKIGCPFKLVGRYRGKSDKWILDVINETHNHDPAVFEEGHAQLRKMSDGEMELIERLYQHRVKPSHILNDVRKEFPDSRIVIQDIYNATAKLRAEGKIGVTPMQQLENFLQSEKFVYHTRENPSTNSG